jgi:hypothetical protein
MDFIFTRIAFNLIAVGYRRQKLAPLITISSKPRGRVKLRGELEKLSGKSDLHVLSLSGNSGDVTVTNGQKVLHTEMTLVKDVWCSMLHPSIPSSFGHF